MTHNLRVISYESMSAAEDQNGRSSVIKSAVKYT